MKSDFALFIIISITGHILVFGLSVQQTPVTINTSEAANVSIKCHIRFNQNLKSYRVMVLWLKNNVTEMLRETFNTSESKHRLYSGNVSATSTLHLHSIQLHHTGVYYCIVWQDVPRLTSVYGKGTHVYIVNSSTDVTTSSSPPLTTPTLSEDTVMISSLSVLGVFVLMFCIAFVIHIHYKKQQSSDLRAKDTLVDAIGLQSIVTSENSVVYAAINIQKNQESVKTRNENCESLVSATVSCIEDTVTYSEVHIKSKLMDEG